MPRTAAGRAARNAEIRSSSAPVNVLAARHGLSIGHIARIRATGPRMPTRRERYELEVLGGTWAAACMEPDEWTDWVRRNPIGLKDGQFADRPCVDCPLGFAAEMRALGRCNGSPGAVGGRHEPAEDDDVLNQEEPVPPRSHPAHDGPGAPAPVAKAGVQRTDEQKARMAAAQVASWERRRAAKAATAGAAAPVHEIRNISAPDRAPEPQPRPGDAPVSGATAGPTIVLPCGSCSHAVVCSIRPVLEHDFPTDIVGPHPAIHLEIRCDHYLAVAP